MNLRALARVLAASLALAPLSAFAADTLVVAGTDGSFKPGLAKSWTGSGDTVTFILAEGVDGKQTASLLKDRLAQAKVAFAEGKLTVTGIPMPALLDQLAHLSLSGEADPLAVLASLGGSVPSGEGPEAGGSIRASKPTAIGSLLATPALQAGERVDAEVVDVVRGAFPQVSLKLKVRHAATSGPLKGKLASGKVVEFPVLVAIKKGYVDFSQAATQRNLAAYYLRKGDRVAVHAVEAEGGRIALDWVERQ
jgi:hypothetical protein